MSRLEVAGRLALTLLLAFMADAVHAFCFPNPQQDSEVYESYDARTDRFFLSWTSYTGVATTCVSVAHVEEAASPGSVRTGLSFTAWSLAQRCATSTIKGVDCERVRDVCRFRAAGQEPPSRFFTIDAAECEALKHPGSGWIFEPSGGAFSTDGYAPLAASGIDPATGQCPEGLAPVYRFYNNRWREGLSNHRFVTDRGVRLEMQHRPGWSEEGIAFCVPRASRYSIASVEQYLSAATLAMQSGHCAAGVNISSCLQGENMGLPLARRGPFVVDGTTPVQPLAYYERTGAITPQVSTFPAVSDEAAATRSFLQVWGGSPLGGGIFVSSGDRAAGDRSALGVYTEASRLAMRPFLPAYDVDMDFVVQFDVFVKRVRAGDAGAYAALRTGTVFRDSISGRRITLLPAAIGTQSLANALAQDPATGEVLVTIVLGTSPGFGRSLGVASLVVPGNFDATNGRGDGGAFDFRINRTQFGLLLDRAREIDPRLSGEPGDYVLESITMKGEVSGDAQIGFNVQRFSVGVARP